MDRAQRERQELQEKISVVSPESFASVALDLFHYQSRYCSLYRKYLNAINKRAESVSGLKEIPFLPIELFKRQMIRSGEWQPEAVFTSSGTSGQEPSRHAVRSVHWYDTMSVRGFEAVYGPVEKYCLLALLPSYLERQGSSLVHMAAHFIERSRNDRSGFYLHDYRGLYDELRRSKELDQPTILLGVSFALLDLAERRPMDLRGTIVMETGGMKGRREEITRGELHQQLRQAFQLSEIHSEYGMTELLSQGWSTGNGVFYPSPTMKIMIREITDPFGWVSEGNRGGVNVIDLANLDSVAFIATEDLGRSFADGSFEVLGRFDHSEIRGCNLMLS